MSGASRVRSRRTSWSGICPTPSTRTVVGGPSSVAELTGDTDLRLWVLHVDSWEVHIGARYPHLGTGRDRRVPVDPRV